MTGEGEKIRQFGTPLGGKSSIDRPGVYALAVVDGLILVVETPAGWFLPGGGVMEGESPEAALRREVEEETGNGIATLHHLGAACQFVGERINKVETFFTVVLDGQGRSRAEPDYRPRWVDMEDAIRGLKEEAQAWAVTAARDAACR